MRYYKVERQLVGCIATVNTITEAVEEYHRYIKAGVSEQSMSIHEVNTYPDTGDMESRVVTQQALIQEKIRNYRKQKGVTK